MSNIKVKCTDIFNSIKMKLTTVADLSTNASKQQMIGYGIIALTLAACAIDVMFYMIQAEAWRVIALILSDGLITFGLVVKYNSFNVVKSSTTTVN